MQNAPPRNPIKLAAPSPLPYIHNHSTFLLLYIQPEPTKHTAIDP